MNTHLQISLPAYQDQSMEDRPGEEWKDIPGFKKYFQVSNFGRVKRLAREVRDAQGGNYTLPPAIRKAVVNKDRNMHAHDWTYRLQIVLQYKNKKYSFQVARLVYYCFVAPFDLKDMSLVVSTINVDGLDIRPGNLVLLTQAEKCKRPYHNGRQRSHLSTNKFKLIAAIEASKQKTKVMVSQYDAAGNYIATFDSITEAAHATNICYASIAYAAKLPARKAGGFFWRRGDANKVNFKQVNDIIKKRQQAYKEKKGIKVGQYDKNGAHIATFYAISEAARKAGVSHKSITNAIRRGLPSPGGWFWKTEVKMVFAMVWPLCDSFTPILSLFP